MTLRPKPFQPIKMLQIIGGVFFAYLFFGFMLLSGQFPFLRVSRQKSPGLIVQMPS